MSKCNIAVLCYGRIEYWKSRQRAIGFYRECAAGSEGCEKERYTNILMDLYDGKLECCDESHKDFVAAQRGERYLIFPNGTSVRDLNGKVEFPKS